MAFIHIWRQLPTMKRALHFSQDNSHLVGNMSRYLQLVNFLCYCVSISSVNIWSQRISLDGKGETDLKYEESETTFLVHSNWTLKLEPFLRVSVHNSMACALQCCKRVVCLSFNLAVYSRSKQERKLWTAAGGQVHFSKQFPSKSSVPWSFQQNSKYLLKYCYPVLRMCSVSWYTY